MYQTIIDKVIDASKNDFDEFGVDQSTLEEMKAVGGNMRSPAPAPCIICTRRTPFPAFLSVCTFPAVVFSALVSVCVRLLCAAMQQAGMWSGAGWWWAAPKAGLAGLAGRSRRSGAPSVFGSLL